MVTERSLGDVLGTVPVAGVHPEVNWVRVEIEAPHLIPALRALMAHGWVFAGIVVEEDGERAPWRLTYLLGADRAPWVGVEIWVHEDALASVSSVLFAADWQEREAEDLYGIEFRGHPFPGDFALHEGSFPAFAPMRRSISPAPPPRPRPAPRIVDAPGGFTLPVGPVFSGVQESVQFLLETVGEEIIFAHVRLFYKFRAAEKTMEGRTPDDAILIAERVDGTAAFAHGLAFAQAVEALARARVPERARALRVLFAELERIRSHVAALTAILESTGLSVPASLLATQVERLLEISGEFTGHRYLMGLMTPGGLRADLSDADAGAVARRVRHGVEAVDEIYGRLTFDESFLDRLEAVGRVSPEEAATFGAVGPVARASNLSRDLRAAQPYSGYEGWRFDVPVEKEGDGYARWRVLMAEVHESARLLEQVAGALPPGPVRAGVPPTGGVALGFAEAPTGALVYWVRTDPAGQITRCRIITPGLANWHVFPTAVRSFAFQDLPIILATFGLSVADADR